MSGQDGVENGDWGRRIRFLEIDDLGNSPRRHRSPITDGERAALRRYLDTLDDIDRGAASARADSLPLEWARLRELLVATRDTDGVVRRTGDEVVYRTVDRPVLHGGLNFAGGMLVCRMHVLELRAFTFRRRQLKIRALGVRERLGLQELRELMHDDSPLCQMCKTVIAHGNVCYNDECAAPLHPQWPAVYCSNDCALDDL